MTAKIHIVGIGDDGLDGLTGHARELVNGAEVLIGNAALFARLPDSSAQRVTVGGNLDELQQAPVSYTHLTLPTIYSV